MIYITEYSISILLIFIIFLSTFKLVNYLKNRKKLSEVLLFIKSKNKNINKNINKNKFRKCLKIIKEEC